MRRSVVVPALLAAVLGCEQPPAGDWATLQGPAGREPAGSATTSPGRAREVMRAKLVHAHLLLDAIVLEDLSQIEQSARELNWLSRLSEWHVHDTETYRLFSQNFQQVTEDLARHAAQQDMGAVRRDHIAMTEGCMDCHTYLRGAGLEDQLPGVVSWAPGSAPGRARRVTVTGRPSM